jgi:hypothetical protein
MSDKQWTHNQLSMIGAQSNALSGHAGCTLERSTGSPRENSQHDGPRKRRSVLLQGRKSANIHASSEVAV